MRLQDTIIPLAHVHISDTDVNVYISVCTETHHLHIFKYNDVCCDYEVFDSQGLACEFIQRPLPGTRSPKY